jgi:anti-sigma B factor antagonist
MAVIPPDTALSAPGFREAILRPVAQAGFDAGNSAEFKREVAPLMEATSKLVHDLSRPRFVDSSGLGAFISCLRKLNAKGGDVKLCGMSRQVRTVFELVRMHRIFDIYGTKEEAVRAFAP